MANSLITSNDFSNISFLLNNSEDAEAARRVFNAADMLVNEDDDESSLRNTSTSRHFTDPLNGNSTFRQEIRNATFNQDSSGRNSTFKADKRNSTFDKENMNLTFSQPKNSTFVAAQNRNSTFTAGESENTLEDLMGDDDSDKNKTFDKYTSKVEPRALLLNNTFMQSTPVASSARPSIGEDNNLQMSPITSINRAKQNNRINRNLTKIVHQKSETESEEDFLFAEHENDVEVDIEVQENGAEEILTPAANETFNCEIEIESNEKDFEEMLNNLTIVKKSSNQSDKLMETLKRYSFTNIEKQKKEILNDAVSDCSKTLNNLSNSNDSMHKSTERLLNRRSRLYDDVNLQIAALSQKQNENEINKSFTSDKSSTASDTESNSTSREKADSVSTSSENIIEENVNDDRFKTIRLSHKEGILNERNRTEQENGSGGEENYRDRFKTIRLSKKIPAAPTKSQFQPPVIEPQNRVTSKLKSPMGFKSKSCQSLVNNNPNLKLYSTNALAGNHNSMMPPPSSTQLGINSNNSSNSNLNQLQNKRLQTNLRMPRASSLVRPVSTIEPTKIRVSFIRKRTK